MLSDTFYRLVRWIRDLILFVAGLLKRRGFNPGFWGTSSREYGSVVSLDSGIRVVVGSQIAEGGFSVVFEARDLVSSSDKRASSNVYRYALKRIHCPDEELKLACQREAAVHRSVRHPALMPLLGLSLSADVNSLYMLFPLLSHSLRNEINLRTFNRSTQSTAVATSYDAAPWSSEVAVLRLFLRVLNGVKALHEHKYTHRDIKPENVLLKRMTTGPNSSDAFYPVLMDFGSAGPLEENIATRRQVLNVFEQAAQHTTMPYRPPELFEGGVRTGDAPVDFTKVDVWSLGCMLFSILYGCSPFEMEFARTASTGAFPVRVVECTHLRVLGSIPTPHPGTPAATWYRSDFSGLIHEMLTSERAHRPSLSTISNRVQDMIVSRGERVSTKVDEDILGSSAAPFQYRRYSDDNDDDLGVALVSASKDMNYV
jgi:serine/threonine kinase 16